MSDNSILTIVTPPSTLLLTSLANAKAELRKSAIDLADDALLQRYVASASSACANYCRRVYNGRSTFLSETVNEQFRGRGFISPFFFGHSMAAFVSDHPAEHRMVLRLRPVTSIVSITEDGTVLDPATDYELDAEKGFITRLVDDLPWPWYFLKLEVQYIAGFTPDVGGQTVTSATPIPALPYQIAAPAPPGATFSQDLGVVDGVSSAPFENVPEAPGAGQYAVDESGLYTFSAADHGAGVTVKIAFSYVTPGTIPPEIQQAVITLTRHLWFAGQRDPMLRVAGDPGMGQRQYWVGSPGDRGELPDEVKAVLAPYLEYIV